MKEKGDRGKQPHNEIPKVCRSMSECASPHRLAQAPRERKIQIYLASFLKKA